MINLKFKRVDLTEEQKRRWHETMTLMLWAAPGFQHLFYKMLNCPESEHIAYFTTDIPTAATDGYWLLVNPDWFFKLKLNERIFVLCHEVQHNVYNDINTLYDGARAGKVRMDDGEYLEYFHKQMNRAMDFRINPLFVDARIGTMPKQGCYDPKIATALSSAYEVYKKLYEDDKSKGGDGSGGDADGFDIILQPGEASGKDPTQAQSQRSQSQWAIEIAVAQDLEMRRGDIPLSMKRMFDAILDPVVPWTEKIKTMIFRRVGADHYNWRKPDRRFIVRDIYAPGRSGFGAGWVVCWADTSASVGIGSISRYVGELAGILDEVKPRRLTVCWCDAAIHEVSELEDAGDLQTLQYAGVKGGGGTNMFPVMEWIEEQNERPDLMIAFTDGEVRFPETSPDFPMIWASVRNEPEAYPFGDVVMINDQ